MIGIFIRAVGSLLAIYGAAYLLVGIGSPAKFLDLFAADDAERRGAPGWSVSLRLGLALLGVGFLMYGAAHSIVQVIPSHWGSYDDDGDWQTTRQAIQSIFGFFAALCIMAALERRPKRTEIDRVLGKKALLFDNLLARQTDRNLLQRTIQDIDQEMQMLIDDADSDYLRRIAQVEKNDLMSIAEDRLNNLG